MPYSLRGIDAITFSVFRALGLKVLVAPVLGDEAWDEWEQVREEKWMRKIYSEEGGGGDEPMEEEESGEEEGNGDKTRVGKNWHKMRMVSGEGGVGLKVGDDPTSVRFPFQTSSTPRDQSPLQNRTQELPTYQEALIQQPHETKLTKNQFINHHYPLHVLPSVTWLNESSPHWEIAMVNLKHPPSPPPTPSSPTNPSSTPGETEIMWQYSHAAIFIEIPATEERKERRGSR
jgi:hypothetical protein